MLLHYFLTVDVRYQERFRVKISVNKVSPKYRKARSLAVAPRFSAHAN